MPRSFVIFTNKISFGLARTGGELFQGLNSIETSML